MILDGGNAKLWRKEISKYFRITVLHAFAIGYIEFLQLFSRWTDFVVLSLVTYFHVELTCNLDLKGLITAEKSW